VRVDFSVLRCVLKSIACPRLIGFMLGLAGLFVSGFGAEAARGVMAGSEMQGYGRLVLSFDQPVEAKARTLNSVLIIEFDQVVSLDLDRIAAQLPNYLTIARLDPDGKALRFGMNDRFKVDLKPAGERLYVDLLPPRWQGTPPALPADVVQDLVKRARLAEEQLRKVERSRARVAARALDLRVASTSLFKRAVFTMPRLTPVEMQEKDGITTLLFDAPYQIAPELVRSRLAGLVQDIDVMPGQENLAITFRLQDGLKLRGFSEDEAYMLDFSRADGGPVEAAITAPAPQPPASKPDMAKPAPAPPKEAPEKTGMAASESPIIGYTSPKDGTAPLMIRREGATDALIQLALEPGRDATGFALRFRHIRAAPIAVISHAGAVQIVIETDENPLAPALEGAGGKVESISAQRLKGGMHFTLKPREAGPFWLEKSGDDIILQQGNGPEAVADAGFTGAPVPLNRAFDASGKEALAANLGEAGQLFTIENAASGTRLYVVPAPEARFASAKSQNFAEFVIGKTLAGFAVLPLDEALSVTRGPDTLLIGHEIKLNLSSPPPPEKADPQNARALLLDPESWERAAMGMIRTTERALLRAAAETPRSSRSDARLKLARFYLANALYPEAQGVLETLVRDDQAAATDKSVLFHRAFAAASLGRLVEAGQILAEPALADEPEQTLLQAVVDSKAMRYPQALAGFKAARAVIDRYPQPLQAELRPLAMQAAVEANDPGFARDILLGYEALDADWRNLPLQQLYAAKIAEIQGRMADAFAAYSLAAQAADRRIEAEARYGKAVSGQADGKVSPEDARAEFETLTAIWRRSEVEVKSLARLGEIYAGEGRWREAFLASQRATGLMPNHPVTRRMEEAMARRFEALFLDNEADKLSKIEALALYQEFRSLVPPGRRGDEMARRLADRLNELDLVNEAADILEHQVRNRLDGLARSSVATRLAVMHLQNREPIKALTILRETRLATLPKDLKRARALLEARALGDVLRTELAIDILANEQGEDVDRLRADIYWKGKKWREAGESYERVLAASWQGEEALSESQRRDVLRSGLAYVLAEERLSLDRLRGKFMPKMARTEDAAAFNLITLDNLTRPQAFREVARSVVNADTMTDFIAAYRKRYPESAGTARPAGARQSTNGQGVKNG